MANCSQCGTRLPIFTFGEASPYCKTCRAEDSLAPKPRVEETLTSFVNPSSRWLNATNVLIAINASVFLAMVASGISWMNPKTEELLRWGASFGPSTLSGQYWRFITPSFVHIGVIHILLNMWCLSSLGRLLERFIGPLATIVIYLTTAAGAELLSLSWNPMRVGAGASGAIFGIAGALIPILRYGKLGLPPEGVRRLLGYVVRFSLINLFYGLTGHTDNMAHLGGLVTGLLAGLFLARSFALPKEDQAIQRRNVLIATAVAVVLCVFPVAKAKGYAVEWYKGVTALQQKDASNAIQHLKAYTSARPDDASGHAFLGNALHQAKRYPEAVQEYERALAIHPNNAFVQVNLARAYLALNKPDKAVEQFRAGLPSVAPDSVNYLLYAQALKATGALGEAEKALGEAARLDAKEIVEAEKSTHNQPTQKKDSQHLQGQKPGGR